MNHPLGIIVLAAGRAQRMGKAKQLLPYAGTSLIRRALNHALATHAQSVVVVLGAYAETIQPQLKDLPIIVTVNPDWQQGMSSSIVAGLNCLLDSVPNLEAVVITLADQPLVDESAIAKIIQTYDQTHTPIVAAQYNNTVGVPALFHRSFFPQLQQLSGKSGAKQLIKQSIQVLTKVPIPEAAIDIDTPEDYEHLIALENK